jgi:outer membrane protein TolC
VFDTPPEIDPSHIVDTIVQQSPSVKQAQQQVVIAEARLKDAKREVVPDLQLRAGEQANLEQLPEAPGKKTGAQSFASAGIELPLWNRNQGNTRAAEAELEQARQEVTRTQLSLRQQAEVLAQNYLSAKVEAERYRTDLLPRARQAYQLYLEKYQSMAQAYPQVIVSQRTLFELEVHYIDSLDRSWQNAIALENFTLQGGLENPAQARCKEDSVESATVVDSSWRDGVESLRRPYQQNRYPAHRARRGTGGQNSGLSQPSQVQPGPDQPAAARPGNLSGRRLCGSRADRRKPA